MNKWNYLALGIIIIIISGSVWFTIILMNNARMETNLEEYMPSDHPAFVYSDQAEDWFNIKDGVLIAIENSDGIYNSGTLEKIKEISEGLSRMPELHEEDIMSLYMADNITGSELGMDVAPFYTDVPRDPEELRALKQVVRDNQMVYERLISKDETVALITAGMESESFTQEFYREIMDFAHSFEGDTEAIYVAGRPIVEGTMALLGPRDMKRMVPVVLAVIALVLFVVLRSKRAAAATLFSVFISTIWVFGLMAALGVPIYSVTTMIPVMLIAIGVAYGIYFFNHLNGYMHINPSAGKLEGIKYTINILWKPLSMAAFTTMVGFISLLSSQVYPIKYFGLFTAFGIFCAYLFAMLLLPSVVYLFGFKKRAVSSKKGGNRWEKMVRIFLYRKRRIYLLTILVAIISIIGIQRVWINSSFLDNFERDSHIVQTDNFVNKHFGGTSTLNVILEGEQEGLFKDPEVLRIIEEMQKNTTTLTEVGNSFSLVDYIKQMNKAINEDDHDYYKIPEAQSLVAQYLLLYEMSGDPENLDRVVNYHYNKSNVTFQLKGDDSRTIQSALDMINSFEHDLAQKGIELNYAGSGYKALVFTGLILEGQMISIAVSLVLVLLILSLMFRSIRAGLIGIVPITITALISFGVMGLLGIPLSTTTALLSSIAIGIGIDYAIHFIQHYRMYLSHSEKRYALVKTVRHTGKAIMFNALVVITGFLVLLFSVFPPNRTLGALVSMNMFTSLIGTLTIMMVLIYVSNVFVIKTNNKHAKQKHSGRSSAQKDRSSIH